ncbi:hypothetical protein [Desulfonatronum thiodismutans]|uniref:hypothetical protein n=1 Tax=Desulfonatronum thiodismutans TaxID=159290 RepID=UPI0004ABDF29|nr:hypothetical protein [Desulfonatronum thiodismutans]
MKKKSCSAEDVASACIEKIHSTRQPKAVFLFSGTDHQVVGAETKKYARLLKTHPDNFLGIYDSRATMEWLCEDVWHMFHNYGANIDAEQ